MLDARPDHHAWSPSDESWFAEADKEGGASSKAAPASLSGS